MNPKVKFLGKQSVKIEGNVYVASTGNVVGKKESEGPLGSYYDKVVEDYLFGQDNWEKAESEIQKLAIKEAMSKAVIEEKDIRYIIAGDLLGQLIGSTFSIRNMSIPFFGIYGACSTIGEGISLASMLIDGGFANNVIAITSSHFAGAEKQFRFPLDYGNQRPLAATWTVTGGSAVILTNNPNNVTVVDPFIDEKKILVKYITTGTIVDYGVNDSMNMGACMAPAAAEVIYQNFKDLNIKDVNYYDKIITGDLGYVGTDILLDILEKKKLSIGKVHMDCGKEIYYKDVQDVHSGGSGCGCAAVTLTGMIFDKMRRGEWKRILFIPTGALLSTVTFNEGETVPSVAHGVVFETE